MCNPFWLKKCKYQKAEDSLRHYVNFTQIDQQLHFTLLFRLFLLQTLFAAWLKKCYYFGRATGLSGVFSK
jgi:hypothetical protein